MLSVPFLSGSNIYVTILLRVIEFQDARGCSPFRRWFDTLDPVAAARMTIVLYRLEAGNLSGLKALGGGLLEWRVNAGPGYRLYFGRLDATTLVLLGAGDKRRQDKDIAACRQRWLEVGRGSKEEQAPPCR